MRSITVRISWQHDLETIDISDVKFAIYPLGKYKVEEVKPKVQRCGCEKIKLYAISSAVYEWIFCPYCGKSIKGGEK